MLHGFLRAALGVLALFVSSPAFAADCASPDRNSSTRYVSTDVRLRSWSTTYSSTYAVLPEGQRVRIQSDDGEWARVSVPTLNLTGFVASRYLSAQCIEGEELTRQGLSSDQIAEILMARSRSGYSGSCPCPYNTDRAGRSCGQRSAYSRPGGASPLCYRSDVSSAMIERFRQGG